MLNLKMVICIIWLVFYFKEIITDNYNDFGNSQEPPNISSIDSKKREEFFENLKNLRENGKQGYDLQTEIYGRKRIKWRK